MHYIELVGSFLPLAIFTLVASITPGPNNIMVATAGAHAGFRATLPHLLGISIGYAIQLIVTALGIGSLLHAYPAMKEVLRIAATLYLLWLAVKLMTAKASPTKGASTAGMSVDAASSAGRPLSFVGAAAFQWINPKAWMMALTVTAGLIPAGMPYGWAIVCAAILAIMVNLPCVSLWALLGAAIRVWLTEPIRWRIFNTIMGTLLILTALWIAIGP